jgi:hypothetical protein
MVSPKMLVQHDCSPCVLAERHGDIVSHSERRLRGRPRQGHHGHPALDIRLSQPGRPADLISICISVVLKFQPSVHFRVPVYVLDDRWVAS